MLVASVYGKYTGNPQDQSTINAKDIQGWTPSKYRVRHQASI